MTAERKLEGRVALVTGASANIGGALAAGLAAAGAKVACNDIVAETAEATAARIRPRAARRWPSRSTSPTWRRATAGVGAVLDRGGRVDILVNNAVRFDQAGVLDMPVERFRRQVDIIVGGAFVMTKLVATAMVERGIRGSIVNVLSTAAWQGQAGNVGYSTAKSG